MKAVLLYRSGPDVLAKAPVHFPAHRARIDEFHRRGELIAVGPWADLREGAMGIFRTRAAAEQFVSGDPFVENGVVSSWEIRDWNEILLG